MLSLSSLFLASFFFLAVCLDGLIFRWEVLADENTEPSKSIRQSARRHIRERRKPLSENGYLSACTMVRLSHKSWHAADIFYLDQVDIFDRKTILGVARLNIARWYNDVEKFKHDGFNKVIETFYFEERLTNASAESFNALFLIVVSHQS